MSLAQFSDANRYLDPNKLQFANASDALPESTEADRIVRGKLFSVFGSVVDDWDFDGTPVATPNLIIEIAAMLMASSRYAKKYAEEVESESSYAGRLYRRAMELIEQLIDGKITLEDTPSGISWSDADFYPNDDTVDVNGDPLRFATMEKIF